MYFPQRVRPRLMRAESRPHYLGFHLDYRMFRRLFRRGRKPAKVKLYPPDCTPFQFRDDESGPIFCTCPSPLLDFSKIKAPSGKEALATSSFEIIPQELAPCIKPVAGLHRASPSTALDEYLYVTKLYKNHRNCRYDNLMFFYCQHLLSFLHYFLNIPPVLDKIFSLW